MRRWAAWLLLWAALAVPDADWFGFAENETSWFTLLQAGLVVAALLGVVWHFARYLRETDELNRLIQLQALGIGFATGFLVNELAEGGVNTGLLGGVDHDLPVLVMLVTYAIASIAIGRRYR